NAMVTALTQQYPVGEVGSSVMTFPPSQMVRFDHLRREVAHGASAVALGMSQALRLREEALLPIPVELYPARRNSPLPLKRTRMISDESRERRCATKCDSLEVLRHYPDRRIARVDRHELSDVLLLPLGGTRVGQFGD